jgi:hypothetical protein
MQSINPFRSVFTGSNCFHGVDTLGVTFKPDNWFLGGKNDSNRRWGWKKHDDNPTQKWEKGVPICGWHENGETLEGKKIYLNGGGPGLPYRLESVRGGYLSFQLEPSRFAPNNDAEINYDAPSPELIREALALSIQDAKKGGVHIINPLENKVGRFDYFKQFKLRHPAKTYSPAFLLCKFNRAKKDEKFEDGFYSGNSARGVGAYDKDRAVLDKNQIDTGNIDNLRTELRTFSGQATRKNYPFTTFEEMLEYHPNIHADYCRILQKELFSQTDESKARENDIELLVDLRKAAEKKGGQPGRALNAFISAPGYIARCERWGGVGGLAQLFKEGGYDRTTIWRTIKRQDKYLALYESTVSGSVQELLNEYKDKVLAQ